MERRLTMRGLERRRQLMEQAAKRFAEGGYHPTTVAEIVDAVGVGKGVFYWYFESKEQLFRELLEDAQQDLRRAQAAAIVGEADPVRRIELGIRATLAWLDQHRSLSTLFQFAATEERFAPALRQGQEIAAADIARHLKDAIVEGRVAEGDPDLLARAVLGVTHELARWYLRTDEPGDVVADTAVSFCLAGLLDRRGP